MTSHPMFHTAQELFRQFVAPRRKKNGDEDVGNVFSPNKGAELQGIQAACEGVKYRPSSLRMPFFGDHTSIRPLISKVVWDGAA